METSFEDHKPEKLGSAEPWLQAIAERYPMRDGRIDFSKLSGSIERTRSTSWNAEDLLKFLEEMVQRFSLPKSALYFSDTRPDIALGIQLCEHLNLIQSMAKLPQNHYFCCPNLTWCVFFGLGGSMGFAQALGSSQRIAKPPYPPAPLLSWEQIFRKNSDYLRYFPVARTLEDALSVYQLKLSYGSSFLTITTRCTPQHIPSRLKNNGIQSLTLHIGINTPRVSIRHHPNTNPFSLSLSMDDSTYLIQSTDKLKAVKILAQTVFIHRIEPSKRSVLPKRALPDPKQQFIHALRQISFCDQFPQPFQTKDPWYTAFLHHEKLKSHMKHIPTINTWYLDCLTYTPHKARMQLDLGVKAPDKPNLITMKLTLDRIQYVRIDRYFEAPHNDIRIYEEHSFTTIIIKENHLSLKVVAIIADINEVTFHNSTHFIYLPPDGSPTLI